MSFNVEGLKRQMPIFAKLEKKFPSDFCLLQETQTASIEENGLTNKFLKKGVTLRLNSWDKHEAEFDARIDNTLKTNKWGTGAIQYTKEEVTEVETGSSRFQILQTKELTLVNAYFPTDKGIPGVEEYEECVNSLIELLENVNGDREIAVVGDLNWQPRHHQRRGEAIEQLCSKFGLNWHIPKEPTFFSYRGDRTTLDHALTSKGLANVRYKVLTGESVPGNVSTHAMVLWSFKMKIEILPEKEEIEEKEGEDNSMFKKFPRVDWSGGIDLDLYRKKEESYTRISLRATAGLNPAWRMSVLQDMLSEASEAARIRVSKDSDEEDSETVNNLEKDISGLWREIKRRRCGYFRRGDTRHWSVRRLRAEYPEQSSKVREIELLEQKLAAKKKELSSEFTRIFNSELEDENEELVLALAQAQSRSFHAGIKNTKVIQQDIPDAMYHNGRWFYGSEILSLFCIAAEEQSGESRNIPGVKFDRRHVFRKEITKMMEIMAVYDDTKFIELSESDFESLIRSIKSDKSPDIFGTQVEHFRNLGQKSKNLVRDLFNKILENISLYAHVLLSISKACMVWKGKNKSKLYIKNFRRVQVTPVPQKVVQQLVSDHATEAVKAHKLSKQYGFSKNVAFLQASIARECVSKFAVEKGDQVYLIAADVESAFSRTDRVCQLSELGVQGEFGKLFLFSCNFFRNTNVVMKASGQFSTVFPEFLGAPQGALPSPRFFLQYTVPLDNYLKGAGVGYEVAGHKWSLLLVADDSMSFVKGREEFKIVSKIYEHYAAEYSIKYGFEKVNTNSFGPKGAVPTTEGLTFGGYPQEITENSLHVGLNVCQDPRRTEKSNVDLRLAKARGKTFAVMGKVWQERRQIKMETSREMIRGVLKPTLTAGLSALCIQPNDLEPLVKFVEKILRRTFTVRDKAMTAPLYQLLQVAPLECDLSCQVMSLVHNVWTLDGPVKDLCIYLLKETGLKQTYWTTHVNKLCQRYMIPSLDKMLEREPPSKQAFKAFAHGKIKSYYSERLKSKIQRSSSLRYIHEDDFDFRDKKLHPLITTAYNKREVVAMKINILHLIGEYKCGANLFRIAIKKSPSCEYCEDDSDTSEHVLLKCTPVVESAEVQRQLDEILTWLSNVKSVSKGELVTYIKDNWEKFGRWLLNPSSAGNDNRIRVERDHNSICNLIRKTQCYLLACHNARSKAKKIKDVSTKRPGVQSSKVGKNRALHRRQLAPVAPGSSRITKFLSKSNNNNQAAEDEFQASGLTYTDEDRLRLAKGGCSFGEDTGAQLIAISTAGNINPIITAKNYDWGRQMKCRQAVIRFHEHEGQSIFLLVTAINAGILASIKVTTLSGLGPEAAADLCHYAPYILSPAPTSKWDAECPVWMMWSTWPSQLKIHVVRKSEVHCHLELTSEGEGGWPCTLQPYMSEDDFANFEACQERYMTRRIEDLQSWANNKVEGGNSRTLHFKPNDSLSGEMWDTVSRLMEASSPGRSAYLAGLLGTGTGAGWALNAASEMSSVTTTGYWRANTNPVEYLSRILQVKPDALVRYNGEEVVPRAPRWVDGRVSGSPRCEKDAIRNVLSGAMEEIEILKTELTSQNRTTETFQKRNKTLQEDVSRLRQQLAESERRRYNLSLTSEESFNWPVEDREKERAKAEEKKIAKVVRHVMAAMDAINVPNPEVEEAYRQANADQEQDPYYPPGERYVQEVDTEEDRLMKARAEIKLERISAEKRKREAEQEQEALGDPQHASTPAVEGCSAWGQQQGSILAPASFGKITTDLIRNNFPEANVPDYNENDDNLARVYMDSHKRTPQSGERGQPRTSAHGTGEGHQRPPRSASEMRRELNRGHYEATKLAAAGALLPTPTKEESERYYARVRNAVGDSEPVKKKMRILFGRGYEELRSDQQAEPGPADVGVPGIRTLQSAPTQEEEEEQVENEVSNTEEEMPRSEEKRVANARASATSTDDDVDEDLILQPSEEDMLDFEPEEPDYGLLDATDTTKVIVDNLYFNKFRDAFRMMGSTEDAAARTCNDWNMIMETIECNLITYLFYHYQLLINYYLWYLCHIGRSIRSQISCISFEPCESRITLCQ